MRITIGETSFPDTEANMDMTHILAILAARSEDANPQKPDDFIGEDGLLRCGKCGAPKQCRPFEDQPQAVVFCACECFRKEEEAREERARLSEADKKRRICFMNANGELKNDAYHTFDADDSPESEESRTARGYAEHFRIGMDWLLLCGTNGIGKSFYAACICNDLVSRGYLCKFTNISEIASDLWNAENKSAVYADLAKFDLIVLDDFGAERDSEYMKEIQFNVIDSQLRMNRPCIITTNLSGAEIMSPKDKDMKRIFSRIYERVIPLTCKGEDRRRKSLMQEAKARLKSIQGGIPCR